MRIKEKKAGILTPIQRQEVIRKIRETTDRDLLLANRINYAADPLVVAEINRQLGEVGVPKPSTGEKPDLLSRIRAKGNVTVSEKG